MDPPTLMNENTFQSANAATYNLSEIWPFSINGGGDSSGGGLELPRPLFGANLGQFGEANMNREGSGNDYVGGRLREARGGCVGQKRREVVGSEDESAKGLSTSSGNGMNDSDGKRLKTSGSRDVNHNCKADGEGNSGKGAEQNTKTPPEPPKDYIHVRARRGQATDSHSLAERARREKISERMKILQDLVPGCNKLQDWWYVLQFLSMKLEAVNSRVSTGIEEYPSKDFGQQAFDTSGMAYGWQTQREYLRDSSPDWLHMQIGGGFERQT